jgi:AAA+ ATPase superfamily predicted ATPase
MKRNPFILQGFSGKKYFCDRKGELLELIEHVLNDRNFTVYGWRRLGKTSLLQLLTIEVEKKHGISVIYVDLSTCRSMTDLSFKFIEAVYEKFGKVRNEGFGKNLLQLLGSIGVSMRFNPVTGEPGISMDLKKGDTEEPRLSEVLQFLSARSQRTLVVFDEFQQITRFQEKHTEALIRGLTQKYPSVRFGFSGSHRGIMRSMFNAHNRPFYQSTQMVDIGPIARDVYIRFMQRMFKEGSHILSKDLAGEIYDWARGETYSIQLIGNILFSKDVNPDDIVLGRVKKEIIDRNSRMYTEYLKLIPLNQAELLKALAREGPTKGITSKNFIDTYHLGAASTVQGAAQGLQEKEIIFKENDSWYIHDVLFSKWLMRL